MKQKTNIKDRMNAKSGSLKNINKRDKPLKRWIKDREERQEILGWKEDNYRYWRDLTIANFKPITMKIWMELVIDVKLLKCISFDT